MQPSIIGTEPSIDLKTLIRDVPDFPKAGIVFKDITTVLRHPQAFRWVVDELTRRYQDRGIDYVVGIESRGFLFAAPLACSLGAGLIPVRKPGKLPADTARVEYALEYGSDALEIHRDALEPGQKVLIVDDLLATGGTVAATVQLLRLLQADIVGAAFVVELTFLNGRQKLADLDIQALVSY